MKRTVFGVRRCRPVSRAVTGSRFVPLSLTGMSTTPQPGVLRGAPTSVLIAAESCMAVGRVECRAHCEVLLWGVLGRGAQHAFFMASEMKMNIHNSSVRGREVTPGRGGRSEAGGQ